MNTENIQEIPLYYMERIDKLTINGVVTGKTYVFVKDAKKMPMPTLVDERDIKEFLETRKQKCKCSHPRRMFFTQDEIDRAVLGEIDLLEL